MARIIAGERPDSVGRLQQNPAHIVTALSRREVGFWIALFILLPRNTPLGTRHSGGHDVTATAT